MRKSAVFSTASTTAWRKTYSTSRLRSWRAIRWRDGPAWFSAPGTTPTRKTNKSSVIGKKARRRPLRTKPAAVWTRTARIPDALADGRANVYPQALLFGVRPLTVPGRGAVLCASLGLPIRLSDGNPVKPNDYYAAVSKYAGKTAIPDSMAPLPGAELLVFGSVERPGTPREARVRCGEIDCKLSLQPDPDALPDAVWTGGADDAVWHAQDNPGGRGGPEDVRKPLIARKNDPAEPVWLGATPYDHPLRAKLAGVSDKLKDGWPSDADPAVLCDAHKAFQARALHAGDTLEIEGLGAQPIRLVLPPYRAVMATSRAPACKWRKELVRIHTVAVLPAADIGAVFWRAAIALGDDLLGEKIVAVAAALEDIDAPEKDEEDLGIIAAERWLEPTRALDDRPLLPAAMAAAGAPPTLPDSAREDARHQAAQDWARKETGVEGINPFADPDAVNEAEALIENAECGEELDMEKLAAVGSEAMAESRRRHSEAGFEPPEPEQQRQPSERGEALEAEAKERLSRPYRAPREVAVAEAMAQAPPELEMDAEEMLGRLGDARIIAAEPVLAWPAFTEAEAQRFGDEAQRRLAAADPERHIDISGARIGPASGLCRIADRNFEGLLAEETVWRNVEFTDCVFRDTTFAKGAFDNCAFLRCRLERVNLSFVTLRDVAFRHCALREQSIQEMNCVSSFFGECELESLSFADLAVRDTLFEGGSWQELEFTDCLLLRVALRRTRMSQVTYSLCHGPECRFEQTPMHKVWVMGMGFADSDFDRVEAHTCGFLGNAHFQMSRFKGARFEQTGFSNAKFNDAKFESGCVFVRCDFGGAQFEGASAAGVRFLECAMPMSVWGKADAAGAWFM
ncbi:MAG: DUF2169 domain-containing protein, partial [Gammaproteobacteria bacterium]|nr:DUF2169 domain-containing protein [Gammaproteobacteria bacterium]